MPNPASSTTCRIFIYSCQTSERPEKPIPGLRPTPYRSLNSNQRMVFSSIRPINCAIRSDWAVSSAIESVPDDIDVSKAAFSASRAGISVSNTSSSRFSLNESLRGAASEVPERDDCTLGRACASSLRRADSYSRFHATYSE